MPSLTMNRIYTVVTKMHRYTGPATQRGCTGTLGLPLREDTSKRLLTSVKSKLLIFPKLNNAKLRPDTNGNGGAYRAPAYPLARAGREDLKK